MESVCKKLVWAKQKRTPYWPAMVIETPPEEIGEGPDGTTCVMFFGTKNYGWIEPGSMEEYVPNREIFVKKYKLKGILNAVEQTDQYILNLEQNSTCELPACESNTIRVKIERENDDEEQKFLYFNVQPDAENSEKSKNDGNRLMSDYLSVTAKHHQVTLELKKANDMLNVFESEKKIILEQINADRREIVSLKEENMSLKRQIAGKDEIKRSTLISSLKESLNAALEEIIVLQSRLAEPHQLKEDSPEDSDTKSNVVASLKKKIDELNIELKRYIDSATLSSSLSSKLELAQNQNEEIKNQIKSSEEEISSLKSEAILSRTELSKIEKKLDIQTEALQLKENQHNELQKQHEAVKAELVLAKNNYDSSKAENVSFRKDLLAVKSTLESNLEMIKKQDEIIVNSVSLVNSLQNSLQTVEAENKQMLNQSKTLEEEITTLKGKVNSSQDIIRNLQKDKLHLQARLNQIQSSSYNSPAVKRSNPESSSQSSTSSSSKTKRKKNDCSIFEVEKLVDHKIENGKLFYKVRWMSYGPEDDTWECESNLICPEILLDYKKKQNLK